MTAPFDAELGVADGFASFRILWKSFDLLRKSLENGWNRLENAWISLELTLISLSESSLFKDLRGPLGPFFYSPLLPLSAGVVAVAVLGFSPARRPGASIVKVPMPASLNSLNANGLF